MTLLLEPPDRALAQCRALLHAGQAGEAATRLAAAHQQRPHDPAILGLAGQALMALGRRDAAIGAWMLALDLQPGNAAAHARLVEPLCEASDPQAALRLSLEALRLEPGANHLSMVSGVLCRLCRYEAALSFADQALGQQPGRPGALLNRALALDGLGRHQEAIEAGERALAAAPGDALAQYHQAERLLRGGYMTPDAWALYESRLTLNGHKPSAALRVWDGEDITGLTILLHAEQGIGDTLQFVRYAPMVAARAGTVILAVQAPLLGLLQTVPGVGRVVAAGGSPPAFDLVCPLLSLPRIFGTTLGQVPPPLPYEQRFTLQADAGAGLRVGLVWAGRSGFVHDRLRSVPPGDFAVLAGVAGVQFYALQHHEGAPTALPDELGAIDLMAGVRDFRQTAALVAGLDLVIAVDTAVAHLAATMGKPVWLLSRALGCWRWMHDREDSPWYPTMRIFRQKRPGDWADVLRRVRRALEDAG